MIDNEANGSVGAMFVYDDYVAVEWLEVRNGGGTAHGIDVSEAAAATTTVTLRQMLVHDTPGDGIHTIWPITNFRLVQLDRLQLRRRRDPPRPGGGPADDTLTNNTVFGSTGAGIVSAGPPTSPPSR